MPMLLSNCDFPKLFRKLLHLSYLDCLYLSWVFLKDSEKHINRSIFRVFLTISPISNTVLEFPKTSLNRTRDA